MHSCDPAAKSAVRHSTSCNVFSTPVRAPPTQQRVGRKEQDGEDHGQAATDQRVIDAFPPTPLRYNASTNTAETVVWLTNIIPCPMKPCPISTAKHSASSAVTRDGDGAGPDNPLHDGAYADTERHADHHLDGALRA